MSTEAEPTDVGAQTDARVVTGHGGVVVDDNLLLAEANSGIRQGLARMSDSRTDEQIYRDHIAQHRSMMAERWRYKRKLRVRRARRARWVPVATRDARPRTRECSPAPARRRSLSRSSSRSGDSGDDSSEEPEPGESSGRPQLLFLAHPTLGRVNLALARFLRGLAR